MIFLPSSWSLSSHKATQGGPGDAAHTVSYITGRTPSSGNPGILFWTAGKPARPLS